MLNTGWGGVVSDADVGCCTVDSSADACRRHRTGIAGRKYVCRMIARDKLKRNDGSHSKKHLIPTKTAFAVYIGPKQVQHV